MVDTAKLSSPLESMRTTAALLTLAVLAGAVAKAADESRVSWLSDLGTYPAIWVAALAIIARMAPSDGSAAVRAAGFFLTMTASYYAWSSYVLGFGSSGRYLALWMAVALVVVPPLAAAVHMACARRGSVPGLLLAMVAAVPLTDGTVWQLWWAYVLDAAPDDFPLHPVQATVNVAVTAVIIGLLPRYGATRAWALVLLPPVAVAANAFVTQVLPRFVAI